jgi:hypothetical protein
VSGLPELTTNSAFKELIQYQGRGFASPGGVGGASPTLLVCDRLFGGLLRFHVQIRRNR